MSRRLSHAKDVIGVLEAGYRTHVPIAYTSIKSSLTGGTEIINIKGRQIASVFKSQSSFEIEFRGLVPVRLDLTSDELGAQSTHQLLLIIIAQSIPLTMAVAIVNTDKRNIEDLNDMFRPRPKYNYNADFVNSTESAVDVLYIASGFLDDVQIVAQAGDYIEIKCVLKADEVFVGGPRLDTGEVATPLWSYLS